MKNSERHEWYAIIQKMSEFQIVLLANSTWPARNKAPDYIKDNDVCAAILDRYSLIPIHVRDSIAAALVHM